MRTSDAMPASVTAVLSLAICSGLVYYALLQRKSRRRRRGLDHTLCSLVVKLGGSAVTYKDQFETVNTASLEHSARALATRPAGTVVVHGAGSFGHFQAKSHGVHIGTSCPSFNWKGFSMTRLSVCKLNQLVLGALIDNGLAPAAIHPFPRISKRGESFLGLNDIFADVERCLHSGIVPVLHGDAVLDLEAGSGIVSGDALLISLCQHLTPRLAVFLTDVRGIFDRPPSEEGAVLIRELRVTRSGKLSQSAILRTNTASHDVTGGLQAKIAAAAIIAAGGVPVCVCEAGTSSAEQALRGERPHACTLILLDGAASPF